MQMSTGGAIRPVLEFKRVALDGAFEGYASVFDTEDLGRDVIARGAFRASIALRGASGVRMLFQHNTSEPIGVWDAIYEDARGLYVRGRLLPGVARARDVANLMRAGAIDGLSIGFKAVRATRDRATGIRRIIEVDLWEISVVTFPMQPGARVTEIQWPVPEPSAGSFATASSQAHASSHAHDRALAIDAALARRMRSAAASLRCDGQPARHVRDAARSTINA